jgi:hypothetical protein
VYDDLLSHVEHLDEAVKECNNVCRQGA